MLAHGQAYTHDPAPELRLTLRQVSTAKKRRMNNPNTPETVTASDEAIVAKPKRRTKAQIEADTAAAVAAGDTAAAKPKRRTKADVAADAPVAAAAAETAAAPAVKKTRAKPALKAVADAAEAAAEAVAAPAPRPPRARAAAKAAAAVAETAPEAVADKPAEARPTRGPRQMRGCSGTRLRQPPRAEAPQQPNPLQQHVAEQPPRL